MGEHIVTLTDSNFSREVEASQVPVVVDFWAAWCGPCKMLTPILDEVAAETKGKAKVCKLNVDDHGELANRFGVMSIPTLIFFKNGEEAGRLIGINPKAEIKNRLNELSA